MTTVDDSQRQAYKEIFKQQPTLRRLLGDMKRQSSLADDPLLVNVCEQIYHRLLLIEGHVSEVLSGRVDKGKGK